MNTRSQEYVTIIKLNDTEAKNKIDALRRKVDDITAARDKAIAAGKDSNFVKDLTKDLKAAKAELRTYDTHVSKTIATISNLSDASIGDVKKAMRSLKREMDNVTDPQDYKRLNDMLSMCNRRIEEFKDAAGQTDQELKKVADDADRVANILKNVGSSSLADLKFAQSKIEEEMVGLNPTSSAYKEQAEDLVKIKSRISDIGERQKIVNTIVERYNREIEDAGLETKKVANNTELIERTMRSLSTASVTDLKFTLHAVNEEMKHLDRGTKEFKQMQEYAKKVNTELSKMRAEGGAQQSWVSSMADFFNKWQAAVISFAASLTGLTITVRQAVGAYADMEDVMASTRKYTGMTDDEVRDLNEELKKMDTRTAREQLNDFAGAAGRLGLSSKDAVLEFVDGADKISVALGDDLGDGAVDTIGKMAMAFGEDKKKGLRGAMLATGSALNELAQNSSANAGYIVDFTSRLAGMGLQADISQQNIMGFASVLDQNMQQVETSATALGQLITKMYQEPTKFAKLAGQDVKTFTNLLKTDANQAIMLFMESLSAKGGFEKLAPIFSEMGLDGNRAVGVISTIASKLDDVRTAQQLANQAYEDGTSVINEFDTMNDTANAQLDKAKKNFKEITIELGQKLLPLARYGLTTTSALVRIMKSLFDLTGQYWRVLVMLTAAILAYTVAANAKLVITKAEDLWLNILILKEKAHIALTKVKTVLTTVYSTVLGVLTGRITLASAAQAVFNSTVLKNPYVIATAALLALASALFGFSRNAKKARTAQDEFNDAMNEASKTAADEQAKISILVGTIKSQTASEYEKKKALEELNGKLMEQHLANITEEEVRTGKADKVLKSYIDNIKRKIILQSLEKKLSESIQRQLDYENALHGEKDNRSTWAKIEDFLSHPFTKGYNRYNEAANRQALTDAIEDEKKIQEDLQKKINEWDPMDIYIPDEGKGNPKPPLGGNLNGKTGSETTEDPIKKKEDELRQLNERELIMNTIKYRKGEQDYTTYMAQMERITKEGYAARIKVYTDANATNRQEYYSLLKEQSDYENGLAEDRLKTEMQDIETRKARKIAAANTAFNDLSSELYANEEMLNERLYQIDIEAMQERLEHMRRMNLTGTQEYLAITTELEQRQNERRLKMAEDWRRSYNEIVQEYSHLSIEEQELQEIAALDALNLKKLGREEEYQKLLRSIKAKFARMKQNEDGEGDENISDILTLAKNLAGTERSTNGRTEGLIGGISQVMNYNAELKALEDMRAKDMIDEKEYLDSKEQMQRDFYAKLPAIAQSAVETINDYMASMGSYYSAVSRYEEAVTTRKYDKLIEAAGSNSAKAKKLEEQKQKELAAIKTKYNRKAMKIEIAQALASTAVAAINAYKTAPAPVMVWGPIASAMAVAAGMLQIATIKKQHAAEEAGYYEGGFTGGTDYRRKAGIVHQGEFVANHQAVSNPQILPALQLIDQAQKNNTVGSLTAADVSGALGRGAMTVSAPTVNVVNSNDDLKSYIDDNREVMTVLAAILAKGIHATVAIDGQDGVKHQLDLFNRMNAKK